MPHPLRIWNTVPAINAVQFGIERYRQFNIGRQHAFDACRALTGGVPAACALGSVVPVAGDASPAAPLAIHFLASRTPADPVENPQGQRVSLSGAVRPACADVRACRRVVATRCRAGAVRVGHREHRRAPHRASRRRRRANARDGREPRGRARAGRAPGARPVLARRPELSRLRRRCRGAGRDRRCARRLARRSSSMRTCAATTCVEIEAAGQRGMVARHDRATGPTRGRRRRSLPTVAGKS